MGQVHASFGGYDLAELEACTFFTRPEIIHIQQVYSNLARKANKTPDDRLLLQEVTKLTELGCNPFSSRMCQVFSEDGSGDMGFEAFLDMLSVFSEQASDTVKLHYAFRMYGKKGVIESIYEHFLTV